MSPICGLFGRVNLPEFGRKLVAQSAPMAQGRGLVWSDLRQLSGRDRLRWNTLGRHSSGQDFSTQVSLFQLLSPLVH